MEEHILYQVYRDKDYVEIIQPLNLEHQGQIIEIPFNVPDKVEALYLSIFMKNRSQFCIQWMIHNGQELIGQSNQLRRNIKISENWSSSGFKSCRMEKGEWKLLLCINKIVKPGELRLRLRYKKEEYKWLKGDLHMHTTNSDGAFDVEEVISHIREVGLDFLALTDHNTMRQNTSYVMPNDLVVIPGMEFSTRGGDSNIFGLRQWEQMLKHEDEAGVSQTIIEAKKSGAMVSMNHPFIPNKPWEWSFDDFHCIEIWRGEWNQSNQMALDYWQKRLAKGERIVGIGGSDIHDENQGRWYGLPTTAVKTTAFHYRGILEAIRNGQVCVLSGPDQPVLEVIIDEGTNQQIICKLDKPCKGILKLYTQKGLVQTEILSGDERIFQFNKENDGEFYRAEIWGDEAPICITNPVFCN